MSGHSYKTLSVAQSEKRHEVEGEAEELVVERFTCIPLKVILLCQVFCEEQMKLSGTVVQLTPRIIVDLY